MRLSHASDRCSRRLFSGAVGLAALYEGSAKVILYFLEGSIKLCTFFLVRRGGLGDGMVHNDQNFVNIIFAQWHTAIRVTESRF